MEFEPNAVQIPIPRGSDHCCQFSHAFQAEEGAFHPQVMVGNEIKGTRKANCANAATETNNGLRSRFCTFSPGTPAVVLGSIRITGSTCPEPPLSHNKTRKECSLSLLWTARPLCTRFLPPDLAILFQEIFFDLRELGVCLHIRLRQLELVQQPVPCVHYEF